MESIENELLSLKPIKVIQPDTEAGFPRLVRPATSGCDLAEWFGEHGDQVWQLIHYNGALLFRGFTVASVLEFEYAVLALGAKLQAKYGDLPTHERSCQFVRAATPYPPDYTILFHNEASHLFRWPIYQWFYCNTPSDSGGETPIVACDDMFRRLPQPLQETLLSNRLRYVRNFVPGLDVAWQQFFGTSNRHEVEDRCVNDRFDYQWRPDDILQTSIVRPSVLWHQKRQALVFFNQILLHHPACLDEATRSALLELYGHHGLPRSVTFADGTPISDSMIEDILSTAIEAAVCFSWQQGDVLMVDNLAVAHARLAYTGTRRIYVALSQFVENQQ